MTTPMWQKAENYVAAITKGKVLTDLDSQYADKDILTAKGNYVSVKCQKDTEKYDSVLFELELQSTYTSKPPMEGSFVKSEADTFAIYLIDTSELLVFKLAPLREFVLANQQKLRTTTQWTEAANRKQGRVYDRGVNISISPTVLRKHPSLIYKEVVTL